MESRFSSLTVILLCAVTGRFVLGCDMTTVSNMTKCLSSAMPLNTTTGASSFDLEATLRPLCNEGVLTKIIDCVQPVIDNCKDADESVTRLLHATVDLERMKAGWTFICNNLDELSEQAVCISNSFPVISSCIQAKTSALPNLQQISTQDIQEYSCKMAFLSYECMTQLTGSCGNVTEIVRNYFMVAQPPICDKYQLSANGSVISGCDINTLTNMSQCLSTVIPVNMTSVTSTFDLEAIVRPMCSEGVLTKITDCVQPVIDNCKDADESVMRLLHATVDLDRMKAGWTFICNNLDELSEQAVCISNSFPVISSCIQEKTSALPNFQQISTQDIQEYWCKMAFLSYECMTQLTGSCGNVTEIVRNYFMVAQPPICDKYQPSANGSVISGCDINTLTNMSQCLSTVIPVNMTSVTPTFDLGAIVRPMCSEGVLTRIIDCVQPVIDNCKDADESVMRLLHATVDLQKMEAGWTFICDNLDELSEQAVCISNSFPVISSCIQAKTSALPNFQQISTQDIQEYSCKMAFFSYECMAQLTGSCGNVTEIVRNYFMVAQPPICDKYQPSANGSVISGCDMNTLTNMSQCLSTVIPVNITSLTSSFDLGAIVRPLCSEGVLTKIIDCVQPVIDNCRDADESVMRLLHATVDLQRMEAGWTFICDNLDELSEQAVCISNSFPVISSCIQAKTSALPNFEQISTQDIQAYSCRMAFFSYECMTQLTGSCGNVTEIVRNYFMVAQPPICDKYQPSANGSVISGCDMNTVANMSQCLSTVVPVNMTSMTSTFDLGAIIRPLCRDMIDDNAYTGAAVNVLSTTAWPSLTNRFAKAVFADLYSSAAVGNLSEGVLTKVTDCVQPVIDRCKDVDPSGMQLLGDAVDLDRMKEGWNFVCDNLDELNGQVGCISNSYPALASCIQANTAKLSALPGLKTMSAELLQEYSCKASMLDCVMKSTQSCGNVKEIVKNYFKATQPPICDKYLSSTNETAPLRCDMDTVAGMTECLSTAMPDTMSSVSALDFAPFIRQLCREDVLTKITNCVQPVVDNCKDADDSVRGALNATVNLERTREGLTSVCNNLDEINRQAGCISEKSNEISVCIKANEEKLSAEQISSSTSTEEIKEYSCKSSISLSDCVGKFTESCGNAKNILSNLFKVILPPDCDKYLTASTPAPTKDKPESSASRLPFIPSILAVCVLLSLSRTVFGNRY